MNYREKLIPKLEMAKLLNLELILDDPKISGSFRFMKIKNTKM